MTEPKNLDVIRLKLEVMRAQGFNKIENFQDPRYLDYQNLLHIFKALSDIAEVIEVINERSG